jgi:ketosteroid isomerase-like protein
VTAERERAAERERGAELLRGFYEAFNEALANRDNLAPLIARTYTDDVTMEPGETDTWLGGGTVRGRDEMLTFWRNWLAETRDNSFTVLDVKPLGDEYAVDVRFSGRFKRTGIPFSFAFTHVVELRGEMVARLLVSRNREAEEPTAAHAAAADDAAAHADDQARSRPR